MSHRILILDESNPLINNDNNINGVGDDCPFVLGEIAVFESWVRFEVYISRIQQIHIDYWGKGSIPKISKATLEQKQLWWNSGEYEVVIKKLRSY